MSPPIYTPDGSEVSEIVLPDGSTASQVIGPDGNVVFEAGPDIPDSVITRPDDNESDTIPFQEGVAISVKSDWPSIGARLSNLTSGVTKAYLHNRDGDTIGDLIKEVDISTLDSGDMFTFDDVNLASGNDFVITADAEGSNYTRGYYDSAVYPYTSTEVDIIAGYTSNVSPNISTDRAAARIFSDVGDIGFS